MLTEEIVKKSGIKQVETESAGVFELRKCIGEGGQGAVYTTQRKNLLIKLSYASKGFNPKTVYRRYRNLRSRTDLPEYIAKPLNEIKPIEIGDKVFYGYVMELMEDMVSLTSLQSKKNEKIAFYLERLGGIRRIYTLLRKLAEILEQIHAAGYCYGDLNPNNIFVSSDTEYSEVQLIDCDNMVIAADFNDSIAFKGFAAPEIVREHKFNTPLSDTWSFAVVAFFALRQELPFHGKLVTEAATEISTMEKREAESDLPFIDDLDNDNAGKSSGFRDLLETEMLQELFKRTFSGEKSFLTRPALFEWIEALQIGEKTFMKCNNCGKHYIKIGKKHECPFCDKESHAPYILMLNTIITGNKVLDTGFSHPAYLLEDTSTLMDVPVALTKSARIETSFNATKQQLSIQLTDLKELKTTLSIPKEKTSKNCTLKAGIPLLINVKEGMKYQILFPEYTLEIDRDEDEPKEGDLPKFKGVILFTYRGEV